MTADALASPDFRWRVEAFRRHDRGAEALGSGLPTGLTVWAGPVSPETWSSAGPCRASRLRRQHLCLAGRGRRSLIPPGLPAFAGPWGSFGAERKSPRGLSPCPFPAGGTGRAGYRFPIPTGDAGEGEAARQRPSGMRSDRPCPLRDRRTLTGRGPPPTAAGSPGGRSIPWPGAGVPRVSRVLAG